MKLCPEVLAYLAPGKVISLSKVFPDIEFFPDTDIAFFPAIHDEWVLYVRAAFLQQILNENPDLKSAQIYFTMRGENHD